MAKIIDGKEISLKIKNSVKEEVALLKNKGIELTLAVIIVGDDSASKIYVNNKKKACEFVQINSKEYALDSSIKQEQLINLIKTLNNDDSINGILVQLPLPEHINEKVVIEAISPIKDVDAFCNENVGRIVTGNYSLLPCTPAGIIEMLKYEGIDICGKDCVVVGRSNIVGKPVALLLLQNNGTVTICHSKTKGIDKICRNADILIAAVGKANFITGDMIKPGAVVIDVGINRDKNNKLCGDVDFEGVKQKASYITPVPGGVGPMTIAMLMKNTLTAAKLQNL